MCLQFCHLTPEPQSNLMAVIRQLFIFCIRLGIAGAAFGAATVAGVLLYLTPSLPSVDQLRDVHLQTPLKVFASSGELIGEFGEQRRSPISYDDIPDHFVHAILSAEDDNFFAHGGVDLMGLLRAASQIVTTGSIQSGGSTITMQVARNFFLSLEQTFTRKFNEILLALEIEHELTKEEILELYANKIYLGKRAYGVQAAAQVYYGKDIGELSLAQLAMIAGLPKAPSSSNPINDPERALIRRNWILGRMLLLGYIDQAEHDLATSEPVTAAYHGSTVELDGTWVAEMVREEMVDRFGLSAYEDGYEVVTTIDATLQLTAEAAVRAGVEDYDFRHGFRGEEQRIPAAAMESRESLADWLGQQPVLGGLVPAAVVDVDDEAAVAGLMLSDGQLVQLGWDDGFSSWRRYRTESWQSEIQRISEVLEVGDLIRLEPRGDHWFLAQVPRVQAGMVAVDPSNGAIQALVGGYDFYRSRFNRITDANRQPGSNMKPFLYSAALESGYTAASLINDAPIVFEDAALEDIWRPENDSGVFYGPTRLRKALYLSRNLVSIRLLRGLGIDAARDHILQYGFEQDDLPYNLTLALGSQGLEPLKMAAGYSLFANGGYRVEPWFIQEIRNRDGEVIFRADPLTVCADCVDGFAPSRSDPESEQELTAPLLLGQSGSAAIEPVRQAEQVMDPRVAFIMDSILRDVIAKGTGTRAQVLGRTDIAGKTGTTNGPRDAWFSGYNPDMVATTWLGFDDNSVLGSGEFGGSAALPIWIDFMRVALRDSQEEVRLPPAGLVTVRIDPETGERTASDNPNAIFEWFLEENAPSLLPEEGSVNGNGSGFTEQLF